MSRRRPKPRTGDTPLFDTGTSKTENPSESRRPLEMRGMPEKPRAAEQRIYEAAFKIAMAFESTPINRSADTVSHHADLQTLRDTSEQVSRNLKRFELTGYDPTSAKPIYLQYIDSEVSQAAAFARESGMGLSAADRRKAIATRAAETRQSRENVIAVHAATQHYGDVLDAWETAYAALPADG